MKKLSFNFFNSKNSTKSYSSMYKKLDVKKKYPANVKRLEIFKFLIKKYRPKKIIDAGCGAGMPLIEIKKMGFNIEGYDKAPNMVLESKKNLKKHKFSENIVNYGDFEKPSHIKNNSIDCILGMGTFYYSKNFKQTLIQQKKKLKKNGRIIFSLRNKLFDITSMNNYSFKFMNNLYEIKKFDNSIKKKYLKLFGGYSDRKNLNLKNIDDENVYSRTHNPLTIKEYLKNEIGLKCNGMYFYHFHALPPEFEEVDKIKFRKISLKIENPSDWKGYFLASGFVLDCEKN